MPTATLNGCKHHWEETGAGGPLVMLHGASGSSKALTAHAKELGSSFRVITPDMRGMGQSERVDRIPASAWVDDLRALLDHLKIEKANIYGLTVGARVAMRFAIDHPGRVSSLIVDMPIVYNEPEAQANVASQFNVQTLPPKRREEFQNLHGEGWETVVANYHKMRAQPDVQDYLDLRELSKKIAVPMLIMRGDEHGGAYSADHAFTLYKNVPTSNLYIKPKSTAGVVLVSAPQDAYAVIRAFLLPGRH